MVSTAIPAVFDYTFTAGSLFDNDDTTFVPAEQLTLTAGDQTFTIEFTAAASEDTANPFRVVSGGPFDFPEGTVLTFEQFHEFAFDTQMAAGGSISRYVRTVSATAPIQVEVTALSTIWEVGEFYGYRQPTVLGSTIAPEVLAVTRNSGDTGDILTLDYLPPDLSDTTRVAGQQDIVYNLLYIGGGSATEGTDPVPASLVVTKDTAADPDPTANEDVVSGASTVTIDAVTESNDQFTLTLNDDIATDPAVGDTVTIERAVTIPATPGTDAVFRDVEITENVGTGTTIGSIRDQNNDNIYWFTTSDNVDTVYEYDQTANEINILLRGDLGFSTDYLITGVNIIDELLMWTDDLNEPRKININKFRNADHSTIPTRIFGRSFVEADITLIKPHPKGGIELDLEVDNDADQPPFEEVFPRFGYRYRYDDGEYSPFSSFTEPAFIPGIYDSEDHYKEGYNTGMYNAVSAITVSNIPLGTPDVVSIDVLYTESISTTVYTLKTIDRVDFGADPEFLVPQTFMKRSFYRSLPSSQLDRQYDNVPRLAKSQEVTANRVVFGNYLMNFPQASEVDIIVDETISDNNPGLSIKGNRDYEVGVLYEDEFGRQGGLLLGDAGTYTSRFFQQGTSRLRTQIMSAAPGWATHFKMFVRDASNEYHNLVAYNTFNDGAEDDINSEFMWVQFPSDDRNKVSLDTFLVPRRHTHGELTVNQGLDVSSSFTETYPLALPALNVNRGGTAIRSNGRTNGDVVFWDGATRGRSTGIFTAPVDGTYTFVYSGTLTRTGGGQDGGDFVELGVALQMASSGTTFDNGNRRGESLENLVGGTRQLLDRIEGTRRPVLNFSLVSEIEMTAGESIRPIIFNNYRRDNESVVMRGEIDFQAVSTPDDPNVNVELQLPSTSFSEFSRHKIIDIENEAPDIVRNQLPVDLRRLGTIQDYNGGAGNQDNDLFLVQAFNVADSEDSAGYGEGSTILYYHARNSPNGLLYNSIIQPLNIIFDREGLERLRVTDGVDKDDVADQDQIVTVDTSEVEGGLWLGVGAANTVAETGVAGKIRISEISIGYNDDGADNDRSIIRFTLDEAVGINPVNQPIAVFKGDVTDNALKNLQGSFFAKIARATGNITEPLLPTGQSQFDDENNVTTLQSMWFETLPILDNDNLNLFWESTESIPIEQHGDVIILDNFTNCVHFLDENNNTFIEATRIFDRFNTTVIDKGIRVNIPRDEYNEERRFAGLIHSGTFNTRNGGNRLNQFIIAGGITKELEPNYGGIQRLHTRDTDLIVFCEDKVFKVLADKDLLYNADGGGNISASNNVLGQTTPYIGEYGISKNPESFATYGSRVYFTDKSRGVVLRLSQNGLEEISKHGLTDYFRDGLRAMNGPVWGSFDDYHNLYNLRLNDSTLSYDEDTRGWPARKSFLPESGLTLNNLYYTWNGGALWLHNSRNVNRNSFYGTDYPSTVTTIFNKDPSVIKNFKTFNYEGTGGWTAPLILTDQEAGRVNSFFNKEGKWFECVGALSSNQIYPIIEELMEDGAEDFFDEDAVEDGDFGAEDTYVFGDDGTSGGDGSGDGSGGGGGSGSGSGGGNGDGMMGIGDVIIVTDNDGNEMTPQDDPVTPVEITFDVVSLRDAATPTEEPEPAPEPDPTPPDPGTTPVSIVNYGWLISERRGPRFVENWETVTIGVTDMVARRNLYWSASNTAWWIELSNTGRIPVRVELVGDIARTHGIIDAPSNLYSRGRFTPVREFTTTGASMNIVFTEISPTASIPASTGELRITPEGYGTYTFPVSSRIR